MQFSKIIFTAISLALAQTAVAAPNTAAASRYLAFLDQFRLERADLSPDQLAAVDSMGNLVKNLDQLSPESEKAATDKVFAAFGRKEGLAVINPKFNAKEKRAAECECADASAYCDTGNECDKGYGDCERSDWGCGAGGLYACDGQCVA
ncbi:hypothetical protein FQN54_003377 [Arachnomyces sp. PD_36]|nr:hypothetical protein FQN54_003377 [Arachnomyces sp. PD_36]